MYFLKNWIQIPTHFSSFHFEKVVDKTQTKSGNVIQGNSMKKCWSLNNIVISINMQNPNLWLLVVWISMREVDWLCLRSKHNAFVVVVCPLAWHQNNSCILDFMQNRLQNLDLRWYIFADVTAHLDCMGNLYIRKGKKNVFDINQKCLSKSVLVVFPYLRDKQLTRVKFKLFQTASFPISWSR